MPFLVLLLILFTSTPCFSQTMNESPDQVWEVGDRRWTVDEERRFEKWVEETITEDFFVRHQIPTDCADAVYAIRWIYARIAHLPAAATTKQGKWIGHWSTDWKHLPTHPDWDKDERFRAALLYLLPMTWTGTLPHDTYPVYISNDSVTPGTLFLVTASHTGIVGRVVRDGSQAHPLQTWESALPVKVQKLSLRYFFSERPESRARSGLVKFRWPISENGQWKYLPLKDHPSYSEEQYTSGFSKGHADYVEAVASRIDPATYTPMERMVKVMRTVTRLLKERVPIVRAGSEECRDGSCPEGSEGWEVHNTVGRDEMITALMDHLSKIIESNPRDRELAKWMMEVTPIEISESRSVTLYNVYQNHLWFSSNPEDSEEARWGLKKCDMIGAQILATHNSIDFIGRTYRKRDPKYADYSIRQQEYHLGRLHQEWTRAECRGPLPALEKETPLPLHVKESVKATRGSKKCEIISTEIRATKNSIGFIEKTYRKKDPDYADFSIRQQDHLLQKLSEEWVGSKCGEIPPPPQGGIAATK
jgi:hypothetical protein